MLKRKDFRFTNRNNKRLVGKTVIIDICQNNLGYFRLGITASKKFGDAFQRNRFKRLVREAFRLSILNRKLSYDLNVKPRHLAHRASMQQIQEELNTLIFVNSYEHSINQST